MNAKNAVEISKRTLKHVRAMKAGLTGHDPFCRSRQEGSKILLRRVGSCSKSNRSIQFESNRVGSGRVGSGRVGPKYVTISLAGSEHPELIRPDPSARGDPTRENFRGKSNRQHRPQYPDQHLQ